MRWVKKFASTFQALDELVVQTQGQGFMNITSRVNDFIARSGIKTGLLTLYAKHTSCSLTINENADPRVLEDLSAWMDAVVPQDGKGPLNGQGQRHHYKHDDEGNDDMPAHIRTALTSQTMTLSVDDGRLLLGMWQAVYLWEHRAMPHRRRVACHLIGECEAVPAAPQETSTTAASAQTLMKLRSGERINRAVQERFDPTAWERDGGIDTDMDLLIDRLHEISNDEGH